MLSAKVSNKPGMYFCANNVLYCIMKPYTDGPIGPLYIV